MSADRVRYPCRCCFIECEPYDATSKTSKVYPCRDALRLWARAMHLDYGDEVQTVWGVFCERDLDAEYAHGHYIDNYATKQEAIDAWNRREHEHH